MLTLAEYPPLVDNEKEESEKQKARTGLKPCAPRVCLTITSVMAYHQHHPPPQLFQLQELETSVLQYDLTV